MLRQAATGDGESSRNAASIDQTEHGAMDVDLNPPDRLTILLAEDNDVNQRVAVGILEKRGHTVVIANNGKEANQAIATQKFDLVLMDVQMPEMDGIEATAHGFASWKPDSGVRHADRRHDGARHERRPRSIACRPEWTITLPSPSRSRNC